MHAWTLFYVLQFIYVAVAPCLTKGQRQTLKLGGGGGGSKPIHQQLSKRARGRSAREGWGAPLDPPLALYGSFLVAVVEFILITVLCIVTYTLSNSYSPLKSTQNGCQA